jgi:hypothetical protein
VTNGACDLFWVEDPLPTPTLFVTPRRVRHVPPLRRSDLSGVSGEPVDDISKLERAVRVAREQLWVRR